MNSYLLNRSLGVTGPQALQQVQTARLLHALQAASDVRFDSSDEIRSAPERSSHGEDEGLGSEVWAHRAGVNCLAIDKFEGR